MGFPVVNLSDLGSEAVSCLVAHLCLDVFEETVIPHSHSSHLRSSMKPDEEIKKKKTQSKLLLFSFSEREVSIIIKVT